MRFCIKKVYPWLIFLLGLSAAASLFFVFLHKPQSFEVQGTKETPVNEPPAATEDNLSPLSGLACDNYQQRPIALMLSSDFEARPLSGLAAADLVIEMPVVLGGATRLMAVYICGLPEEIGSVRSARHDFIPLAQGLDAIYVHWGGSHFALDVFKKDIIDNLDALSNPFETFYRKPTIAQPHNGFTSGERILNAAQSLGYRLTTEFEGYVHQLPDIQKLNVQPGVLTLGYPGEFAVRYNYDPQLNQYLRWRDNKKEIDRNDLQQVAASVVVVMRAQAQPLEGQYNHVIVEGQGQCQVYQNGQVQNCIWQKPKNSPASKLKFLDSASQEIKFTPGQIWLEIIEPDKEVKWTQVESDFR